MSSFRYNFHNHVHERVGFQHPGCNSGENMLVSREPSLFAGPKETSLLLAALYQNHIHTPRMAWGWVNDVVIFIFGLTISLNLSNECFTSELTESVKVASE